MPVLELKNVSVGYGRKKQEEVLHDFSFKIQEPSIYVVLGPNGAGKTTLFRTISGILQPYKGDVEFGGFSVFRCKEVRKMMNYLSHFNALPEEMTVYEALKFYSNLEGGNPEDVIEALNLRELMNLKISDLSQGQKKRVSIAKVFLRERDLYLLDEPTSNLDPNASREIREILLKLSKDKIVLYSSHNLYEAKEVGTYIILIKEGKLKLFDKISNLKPGKYKFGIKTTSDISRIIGTEKSESGYYIISVNSPEEAGAILKELVYNGITVTEMRELDNPLEELFVKE
jgi:ABC-2 type transport system ATP-binding protein